MDRSYGVMNPLTPPLTPLTHPQTPSTRSSLFKMSPPSIANKMSPPIYEEFSPNFAPLPESVVVPALDLDLGCEKYPLPDVNILSPVSEISDELHKETNASVAWREDLTQKEKIDRQRWLSGGRGRSGLRIVIVTGELRAASVPWPISRIGAENFLPKVDGVTRTLARLLEHLEKEGHKCMLLGPGSGMDSYAGHPLVGTAGVPLVLYPGLKVSSTVSLSSCRSRLQLNFLRPKFLRAIMTFVRLRRVARADTVATRHCPFRRSHLARCADYDGHGTWLGWRVSCYPVEPS